MKRALYFFVTILTASATIAVLLSAPKPALAQSSSTYEDIQREGLIFAGICTGGPCPCRETGDCTLEDMLQLLVNAGVFLLGISGSMLLLMFIWGGITWLTSEGNSTRIDSGKRIIVAAIVGFVIMMSSYALIVILLTVVKTGELPEPDDTLEDALELRPVENAPFEGASSP
ncbi:MAG: hypothetical protein O3B64_02420 [bacterium]|nr:hypothetical protein [bacterium]MDA1024345.1 hypothetical protein [bacterium]